ncbi:MAG TPA: carbamoyltransferase C-terminal domain-containing protein [Streptosporangiaceae bacterium]
MKHCVTAFEAVWECAAGAATRPAPVETWSTEFGGDESDAATLAAASQDGPGTRPRTLLRHASELLTEALRNFLTGLEAGPRALGHRSILASPLLPNVIDRLNSKVKLREPFRPFAPIVLEDQAATYFDLGAQQSPFMSIAVPGTLQAHRVIPLVFHANGLARVQTVEEARDPLLAAVLQAFAARTGVPVLINTSLNVNGRAYPDPGGSHRGLGRTRIFCRERMRAVVSRQGPCVHGPAGPTEGSAWKPGARSPRSRVARPPH